MWNRIKHYVIKILIALGVGGLAALLTRGNMDIYNEINTPALSPPAVLFPIVWSVLYVLMGVSAARVYSDPMAGDGKKREAMLIYYASLILNFAWSIIFFNLRSFGIAFVCIVLLLLTVIGTILKYKDISGWAAILQIPSAVWVAFAAYLNLAIGILN